MSYHFWKCFCFYNLRPPFLGSCGKHQRAGDGLPPIRLADLRRQYASSFPRCFEAAVAVYCDPASWTALPTPAAGQGVFRAYGVHPHHADHFTVANAARLDRLLKPAAPGEAPVVALGEIGLDYSRKNGVSPEVQQRTFAAQLRMALERDLPVVLHLRNAVKDGFRVLAEVGVPPNHPLHVHCFNGSWDECRHWLDEYPGELKIVRVAHVYTVSRVTNVIPSSIRVLPTCMLCQQRAGKGNHQLTIH